jgi:Ca2+-transporting ATPase
LPFSSFFWFTFPLLAIHILWINLVTDGLPGLALALNRQNNVSGSQGTHNKTFFAGKMALHIISVVANGFSHFWAFSGLFMLPTLANNCFTVLCFSQMGHVMAIRSGRESL